MLLSTEGSKWCTFILSMMSWICKNTKYKPMINKEWLTRILPDENSALQCSAVLTGNELLTLREACCPHLQGIAYSTANPANACLKCQEIFTSLHIITSTKTSSTSHCEIPRSCNSPEHFLTCRTTFKTTTTNEKGKWIFCYQFSPGIFRHTRVCLTYIYLKTI